MCNSQNIKGECSALKKNYTMDENDSLSEYKIIIEQL